jgi:predicted Rossmann-fold nucleotide-binding protein
LLALATDEKSKKIAERAGREVEILRRCTSGREGQRVLARRAWLPVVCLGGGPLIGGDRGADDVGAESIGFEHRPAARAGAEPVCDPVAFGAVLPTHSRCARCTSYPRARWRRFRVGLDVRRAAQPLIQTGKIQPIPVLPFDASSSGSSLSMLSRRRRQREGPVDLPLAAETADEAWDAVSFTASARRRKPPRAEFTAVPTITISVIPGARRPMDRASAYDADR